jgi:orotidine-5'-phosphate decarboxylase
MRAEADRARASAIRTKVDARIDDVGSLLCVGLDSQLEHVPDRFRRERLPQLAFNREIIERTHDLVLAYKPNLAFYEARGSAGWHELKLTVEHLRSEHPGILTIADAKRADIGSTNVATAAAIFDELGCDAVTLNPYLGGAALAPFLERTDRASIVLCRTSDPGSGELQDLDVGGRPLWEVVATRVRDEWDRHGTCMLVVAGTRPAELRRVRELCPDMTFLVPGLGAQGGSVEAVVEAGRDDRGRGLILNASRSVILDPDPRAAAMALRDRIRAALGSERRRGAARAG